MTDRPSLPPCGDILRRYRDVFVGIILLVVFALIIVGAQNVQMIVIATIDARFWPTLVGILGCILSVAYVLQSYILGTKRAPLEATRRDPRPSASGKWREGWDLRTLITLPLLFLYVLSISALGWILSTILYLFLQFFVFTDPEDRNLPRIAIIAVVFTAAVYFFFRYVFLLMLPAGSLW